MDWHYSPQCAGTDSHDQITKGKARRVSHSEYGFSPLRHVACSRLPGRGLNHARGCATGLVSLAIAVPSAPTFALGWPVCLLPIVYAVSYPMHCRQSQAGSPRSAKADFRAVTIVSNSVEVDIGSKESNGPPTAKSGPSRHSPDVVIGSPLLALHGIRLTYQVKRLALRVKPSPKRRRRMVASNKRGTQ